MKETFIIALCLLFITPVFIAISSKYQLSLPWGTGHVPVYYSYFGVALVLCSLFSWFTKRFVSMRLPIVILVAVLITANFLVNCNVVNKMDNIFDEPRSTLAKALESGLIDDLHDGDYLNVGEQLGGFMTPGFFYRYSEKKLIIEGNVDLNKADNNLRHSIQRHKQFPYRWIITVP